MARVIPKEIERQLDGLRAATAIRHAAAHGIRLDGQLETDTPLASVFASGRYVGAILHRGPKGYEAIGADARFSISWPIRIQLARISVIS